MTTLIAFIALLAPSDRAFDQRLDRLFARSGVPGAGVRVITNGRTVYDRAFGVADESTKKPSTTKMAFEIGSLSKQFAAACILMLVHEGKISLSDRIGDVISDLPES